MAPNGNLPLSSLVKVDGWAYLAAPTAASWVGFCNEMQSLGYPRPGITAPDGAYRTLAQQHYWKAYWTGRGKPGNAATPGYSNHGWGTAIDIFNVYRYPRNVIVQVAAKWGFTFNVPSELWHMQHNGVMPAGGAITPIEKEEEEDMQLIYVRLIMPGGGVDPDPKAVIGSINRKWTAAERSHFYNIYGKPGAEKIKGVTISWLNTGPEFLNTLVDMHTNIDKIANLVVKELPKTGAGLTVAQVEAAVKSAMAAVNVTANVDAQAIAKAVNEDAARRLRD